MSMLDLQAGIQELFLDAQAITVESVYAQVATWLATRSLKKRDRNATDYGRFRAARNAYKTEWRRQNREQINAARRAARAAA